MTKTETGAGKQSQAIERFRVGLRIALEEMLTGRDYARVETILRGLEEQAERIEESR